MKIKDIIFNAIWFGVIPKLTIVATLFVTPLVTPYLTRIDYGNIGIINSYIALAGAFSTLGLHMHLSNTFFELKKNYNKAWGRLLYLMLGGGLLAMILVFVCLYASLEDTIYPKLFVVSLAVIPIIFNINQQIATSYYTLIARPRPLVLRNLCATFLGILIFFISARYLRLGYLSWLISSFISAIVLFLLFFKPLWIDANLYPRIERSRRRILYWIKIALPVIPHNIGHTVLVSSDRIIMNILGVSTSLVGIYSQGYVMGDYVNTVIMGLLVAISPLSQKYYREANYLQLRKIFYIIQSFALFVIFLCCIWMHEIYTLLIKNETLQAGQEIACYTMFAYAIFPLYSFVSLSAFILKKTKILLWLIWVPAVINIISNFIVIPIWGYKSAIITTLFSYWSIGLIIMYHPFYKKEIELWLGNSKKIWLLLILYFVLLVVSNVLKQEGLLLKGSVSVIVFLIIGYCIYKLKGESFDYIIE